MSDPILLEEFEVLESIYPEELTKSSERDIQIDVEPDEVPEGEEPLKLSLSIHYPEGYPDVLPELELEAVEGDVSEKEIEGLLDELKTSGEENIGMAMTFTLVTLLKDQMADMVGRRIQKKKDDEVEKERREMEAEEARTRGTAVTEDSFLAWVTKFDAEMNAKKAKEEEERLKGLTPKEREEYKRMGTRLSGRQLFERDKNLDAAEDSFTEEGVVSVDISQYERVREEEEEERITFSDED